MSYLAELTFSLSAGAARFDERFCRRHAAFLLAAQNADGGFSGRQGASDLYYTSFALRALALLGRLDGEVADRVGGFLAENMEKPLPPIDRLSLVLSAALLEALAGIDLFARAGIEWRVRLRDDIETLRRPDGGYAKTARGGASSTYYTFLVGACLELLGEAIPECDRMAAMIRARQRSDGGFVELDGLSYGGTNPTAAAVGLLKMLNALDEPARSRSAQFLAAMQNGEGGFRANTRIPIADLLSTFAALTALIDLGAVATIDAARVRRYAESLEMPDGGFRGAAWDDRADFEYTFYGLGVLALLQSYPLSHSSLEPRGEWQKRS